MKTYLNLSLIRKIVFAIAVMLVSLLCVMASEAMAQTRADVDFNFSSSRGLGYSGYSIGGGGHVFTKQNRFAFDGDAAILRAHKISTGDGHGVRFDLLGRGYITDSFYVVGGLTGARQYTSDYVKTAVNLDVGIGYSRDGWTVQAMYEPKDFTSKEKLRGFRLDVEDIYPISESTYIVIRPRFNYVRFDSIRSNMDGVRIGLSVGIGRRNK